MRRVLIAVALALTVSLMPNSSGPAAQGLRWGTDLPVAQGQRRDNPRQGLPEVRDRTTTIRGQMNPGQKRRASLPEIAKWNRGPGNRLLDELLSPHIGIEPYVGPNREPPMDTLVRTACDSDAVVVGTPYDRSSFPTEDGSFLFSDYKVRVSRVVRREPSISSTDDILVSRPGGSLNVEGITVSATISSEPPLQLGRRYLFLLDSTGHEGEFVTLPSYGIYAFEGMAGVLQWHGYRETVFSDAAEAFRLIGEARCE